MMRVTTTSPAGTQMPITLADGRAFTVMVPAGVQMGQEFQFSV